MLTTSEANDADAADDDAAANVKDAADEDGNENAVDAADTACCSSDRQYFETATASLDNSLTPIQNSKVLMLGPTRQKYSSTL